MQDSRQLFSGSGSPEGKIAATAGACYLDASAGVVYHKGVGSGTTGWVAISFGSSAFQTATVTITSAQLKALHATPIQIVAAPGAGKALMFQSAWLQYKAGATPYTVGVSDQVRVYYVGIGGSPALDAQNATGFLDQATSQVVPLANQGLSVVAQSSVTNSAIAADNSGSGEWTDGNGTLIVTVYYSVVDLA